MLSEVLDTAERVVADAAAITVPTQVLIAGDADLLHRALFNLLLNAGQFSAGRGQVTVEVDPAPTEARPSGLQMESPVRVVVSDSGPGVDANDLSRIFDPFYTKREGGSGLGLAVVHRAVEAHDGAKGVIVMPEDMLHIPAITTDGLYGVSPIRAHTVRPSRVTKLASLLMGCVGKPSSSIMRETVWRSNVNGQ